MCRPQIAGYGTCNVPATSQSECHWAYAARFTSSGFQSVTSEFTSHESEVAADGSVLAEPRQTRGAKTFESA